MTVLVTGSSGHLGEALVRSLRSAGESVVGIDLTPSPFTTKVGSITDSDFVQGVMSGVNCVYHTATLHKPHVATHRKQDFIDTNVSGTLVLLEQALSAGVEAFVFTSTTSLFGEALRPPAGQPAVWVTEDTTPIPKNIYGVTKNAAEDVCELFHRKHGLNCIVLRTSRFFPEDDDDKASRDGYIDSNAKCNEFLFRRVELADVVQAHQLARERASVLGFGRYIISATSPFEPVDLAQLNLDAPAVVAQRIPEYVAVYRDFGWQMFDRIDRVYVNRAAQADLGWQPTYDFNYVLERLRSGLDPRSQIARQVGSKGYHDQVFEDGPYPVE